MTFMYLVLFHLNQLYNAILHNNDHQSFIFGRLLGALKYYQCLFSFCCHEVDLLLEHEANLLFLHRNQVPPLTTAPPRNRVIDELTDEIPHSLTQFTKNQLRQLFLHFRMLEVVVTEHRHHFSGQEVFWCFINHLFINFFHKISGRSIEL